MIHRRAQALWRNPQRQMPGNWGEQIPEKERLQPEEVVKEISSDGRPAFYEKNADTIVDKIVPLLKKEDVVVVFSNGGFDNIHEKLLTRLKRG